MHLENQKVVKGPLMCSILIQDQSKKVKYKDEDMKLEKSEEN